MLHLGAAMCALPRLKLKMENFFYKEVAKRKLKFPNTLDICIKKITK